MTDDIEKVKEVYKDLLDSSGDGRITKKKLDVIIKSKLYDIQNFLHMII